MFTHVKRTEGEKKLHISHLFRYVSAYEISEDGINQLIEDLEIALLDAKANTKTVIVDQDGEYCFHVHPSGRITLMIPWKSYEVLHDDS